MTYCMRIGKDIGLRSLIQGALSFRAQMENHAQNGNSDVVEIIKEHSEWLKEHGILDSMEKMERDLIKKKIGSWKPAEIQDGFWKIESFKALQWVLAEYKEMPNYFEVGEVNSLYRKCIYPNDPTTFIGACQPRSRVEIEKERLLYEFLFWRCRTEILRHQGMPPPAGDTYEATISRAMKSVPTGSTRIDHDERDITVKGYHFSQYEELSSVVSTCYERYLALNWVLGDESWSETRTDT